MIAIARFKALSMLRKRREDGLDIVEAAMAAARLRLRPILMTAFAFILGVVPLMFATGACFGFAMAPSQTAQALTPFPFNACSLSIPSHLACAPVAMISVSDVCSSLSSPAQTRNGRFERSTLCTSSVRISAP